MSAQECGPQGCGPTAADLFGPPATAPVTQKPAATPSKPLDMASGARVFSNGKMVNQQQGHQDQSMSTMAGSSAGAMTVADGVPLVGQSGQHSQQEEKEGVEAEASQGSSIACAIATMLFSIPALVGSCCWPILLMSIFGAAATSAFNTAGTRQFFHAITWGLDLAIFTNITHYLVKKCANHPVRGKRPHFKKFAPAYIAGLATCLIMIDLTRHVSNDCWGIWSSEDYSTLWYMMLLTNYSGFTLLFVGVFWGIDFHRKLRLQWRNIKAEREKKKQAREAQVMTQVAPGGRPLMESA